MPKVILAESVECMKYLREYCVYRQAVRPLWESVEGRITKV